MALWDSVKLRYDNVKLKQLTNVNTPSSTSINDTVGTQASSDAAQWFKRISQTTFDDTDEFHVTVGVRATVVLLKEYSGKYSEVIRAEREAVENDMLAVRSHGAGKRVDPTTNSDLTPSTEVPAGETVRANFDDERFDGLTSNPPPAP